MWDTYLHRRPFIKKLILFSVILGAILALMIPLSIKGFGQSIGAKPLNPCDSQVIGFCLKGVQQSKDTFSKDPAQGVTNVILQIVYFLIYVAAGVALLFFVLSAYQLLTSQGDDAKYKKALVGLQRSIIGLVVALVSVTIITLVVNVVTNINLGQGS